MIPHSRPALGEREAQAVAAVVSSGHIAQGPEVAALEAATARTIGLAGESAPQHAVALSSGSAALLVALRILDIGRGDEVLIPAYACTSLYQAVLYAGATPRLFDCDPTTLGPDPDDARRRAGERAAACIVPHLFGRPADIDAFAALGLPIVEDCAQTLGVRHAGRPVGSFGDVTVCSFYATKLVAGGEGGMLLARDRALAARARTLRDCEDPDAEAASFNFKMSDLHAAVAAAQLERLPEFLARRTALAGAYREALRDAPVLLPADDIEQAWFRFVVMLGDDRDLDALLHRCEAASIACRRPVGRLAAAVDLDDLPGCRAAWQRACSLPLYPALSDEEARIVPRRFRAALRENDE